MNIKQKKVVLAANKNSSGKKLKLAHDGNQPPKKKVTIKLAINIILQYSPKKNRAKPIEEYSTLNPATSSASASGKSKGARFVSAKIEIKNMTTRGSSGKQNQPLILCTKTTSVKLRDPLQIIRGLEVNRETS
jgi:hypothetical protein